MASLLSSRRGGDPSRHGEATIRLQARVAGEQPARPETEETPDAPTGGWLVLSIGGALAAALAGWVIVAGLSVVGWLAAAPGSLLDALKVGTQLWLLAHGGGAELSGERLTLVPLGVTLALAFMISRGAAFAARHARGEPGVILIKVVVAMVLCYAAAVAGVATGIGALDQAPRASIGAGVIALVGASWGGIRGLDYQPTAGWPAWSRAVPRAIAWAQVVLLVGGLAALVTAVVVHIDRVNQLSEALGAGTIGGIALIAIQLAFLPNAVLWAGSYTLGAGFSVGAGSLVAPRATDLGLLPGVPLLGALPDEGAGDLSQLLWLGCGVVAGVIAAIVITRARPAARFDETSLVGGLAGVLSGGVYLALAWLSTGGLGSGRLAELGPRLPELAVMAISTMGLAGLLMGLIWGLVRRPR